MDQNEIKHFIEAALLAAGRPLNADQLQKLFDGRSAPEKAEIRAAVKSLNEDYDDRGIVVGEVASGYRIQVKAAMADRLQKLWEERPPRYSRALFETLALIAYRQPITRGEIEEVRGVSVSSNIVRTLMERDWVRVVGHRDVPGRPAMFGTTRIFLDYFGLKKLDDLPELSDLADWESLRIQLNLPEVEDSGEQPVDGAIVVGGIGIEGASTEPGENAGETAANQDEVDADTAIELPDLAPVVAETNVDAADEREELVVSEWPDPVDAADVATIETGPTQDDKDASAGGS